MVARSSTGRLPRPSPKNSTNLPTTPARLSRSVTVSTRSVAVTPSFSLPVKRKPITSGITMEIGWPSMAASASMPPTPQPSTARPFTIVVWLSVPTSVSGKATRAAVLLPGPHGLRQIFEVHLVADAGARRHHAEIVEGACAPAQEGVALAVPLIFLLDIGEERGGGAECIDRHRVIDDEVDRNERIDLARVAVKRAHGVAHGGKIDHGWDAGEILHQHARGAEGDLALALPRLQPLGHAANVVGGDAAPVFMPQQIFQQHLQREGQAADCRRARSPRPPSDRNNHSCACRPVASAGN